MNDFDSKKLDMLNIDILFLYVIKEKRKEYFKQI